MFSGALRRMAANPLLGPMSGALKRLLKLEYLDQFCDETREAAVGLSFLGEAPEDGRALRYVSRRSQL